VGKWNAGRIFLIPSPSFSSQTRLDAVLVWKYSRFARNRTDSIVYKTMLRKKGVKVISITEPADNNSPTGRLNEIYIGTFVWGRYSKRGNPPVRAENVFPALISKEVFDKAKELMGDRAPLQAHLGMRWIPLSVRLAE